MTSERGAILVASSGAATPVAPASPGDYLPSFKPADWFFHRRTPDYLSPSAPRGVVKSVKVAVGGSRASRDAERVLRALERDKKHDFRTVASLAKETKLTQTEVRLALRALGDRVRRPIGGSKEQSDWYRLTERGLTRAERWLRLKAIATFSLMDDDF